MEPSATRPIEDLAARLQAAGLVSASAMQIALAARPGTTLALSIHLVLQGAIDDEAFANFVAGASGIGRLTDDELALRTASAFSLIPIELVHDTGVIPLVPQDDETVLVGIVDPWESERLEEAAFFAGLAVEPRVISLRQMARLFRERTGRAWKVSEALLDEARARARTGEVDNEQLERMLHQVEGHVHRSDEPEPDAEPAPMIGLESHPPAHAVEQHHRAESSNPSGAPVERAPFVAAPSEERSAPGAHRAAPRSEGRFTTRTPSGPVRMPILPTLGEASHTHLEGSFAPPVEIFRRSAAASVATRAAFRQALRGLESAMNRDDVATEIANSLILTVPNVVLFSLRLPQLVVWQAASRRGPTSLEGREFPMESGSVWHTCAQNGSAYRGRIPPSDPAWNLFGREMGEDSIVVPLSMKGRTIALMLLDCGYEPGLPGMRGQWEPLSRAISDGFRRVILTRKRTETS